MEDYKDQSKVKTQSTVILNFQLIFPLFFNKSLFNGLLFIGSGFPLFASFIKSNIVLPNFFEKIVNNINNKLKKTNNYFNHITEKLIENSK